MNTNGMSSFVPAVNHYSEFTARLLQHQEWQQQALREAELHWAVGAAGNGTAMTAKPPAFRRASAAVGVQLVRLGTRLQGAGSPVARSAC